MRKKILTILTAAIVLFASIGAVHASEFVDSATAKPAPEVVSVPGEDGKPAAAVIRDKEGNIVGYVPTSDLLITAYADRETASADIKAELTASYEQLKAKPLTEINTEIPAYLAQNDPKVTPESLIVRDLFDANLSSQLPADSTIEIKFKANLTKDAFLMVMTNADVTGNGSWDLVPANQLIRNADNTVTIKFNHLCPIVFVTSKTAVTPPPHTGTIGYVLLGAAVICIAVGAVMLLKKKAAKA